MNNYAFLHGKRVIIDQPRKTFSHKLLRRKGRFVRKFQRVSFFAGWVEMVVDGQILQSGDSLIMNQKTWNAIVQALAKGENNE